MWKKKRIYRRNLEYIGKNKFKFDVKLERSIYSYLSCYKINGRIINSIEDEFKFDSYKKWKDYICDKYQTTNIEILVEFSRYLNQQIRNTKSNYDYWLMVVPIMLTLVTTKLFDIFMGIDYSTIASEFENPIAIVVGYIFLMLLIAFFSFALGVFIVKQTIKPLIDTDVDYYLYIDYKEIIDELIKCKKEKDDWHV